jgi:hypothetical protein
VSIGLNPTKAELDAEFGKVALDLRNVFRRLEQLQRYCLITPDGTFVGKGYSAGEVAILKSAFSDGDALRLVWNGTNAQTPAKDFRTNLDQLAGDLVT